MRKDNLRSFLERLDGSIHSMTEDEFLSDFDSFVRGKNFQSISLSQNALESLFVSVCEMGFQKAPERIYTAFRKVAYLKDFLSKAIAKKSIVACEKTIELMTAFGKKDLPENWASLEMLRIARTRTYEGWSAKPPQTPLFSGIFENPSKTIEFFKYIIARGLDTRPVNNAGDFYPMHHLLASALAETPFYDEYAKKYSLDSILPFMTELHRLLESSGAKMTHDAISIYLNFFLKEKAYFNCSPDVSGRFLYDICSMYVENGEGYLKNGECASREERLSREFYIDKHDEGYRMSHIVGMMEDTVCPGSWFSQILSIGFNPLDETKNKENVVGVVAGNLKGREKREALAAMGFPLSVKNSRNMPATRPFMNMIFARNDNVDTVFDELFEYAKKDPKAIVDGMNWQDTETGDTFLHEFFKAHSILYGTRFFEELLKCVFLGADLSIPNDAGKLCLHYWEHLPTEKIDDFIRLIALAQKQGVDFLSRDGAETTLYHLLISRLEFRKESHDYFVKELGKLGISANLDTSPYAVCKCVDSLNTRLLERLFENGASATERNRDGNTPMEILKGKVTGYGARNKLLFENYARLAVFLKEHGADIDEHFDGHSLLFSITREWSYYHSQVPVSSIEILLEAGASVYEENAHRTVIGVVTDSLYAKESSLKGCSPFLSVVIPYLVKEIETSPNRWSIIDALQKEVIALAKAGAITKSYKPVFEKLMKIVNGYDRVADSRVTSDDFLFETLSVER